MKKKVWAYVSNTKIEGKNFSAIMERGQKFVKDWKAHELPLEAQFEIIDHYIILVSVNEEQYNASGCSIDKLLRFIKDVEVEFNIQLLNRLIVALVIDEELKVWSAQEVKEGLEKKQIDENTIVYNTSVSNSEVLSQWKMPLKETWLKKYL